jgi:hypothetical protein
MRLFDTVEAYTFTLRLTRLAERAVL